MDFLQYRSAIARSQSSRWTPRQKRLDALSRVLNGKQYEHLKSSFSQERDGDGLNGKRILLDERRPSAKATLPKELVRDQCGLIFGEEHRPLVLAQDDDNTTAWLNAFVHDTQFWLVLMDGLWKGSIGSSLIVLRVLGDTKEVDVEPTADEPEPKKRVEPDGPGRYYFEVWPGQECSPVFRRSQPDVLEKVDRKYFIGEDALSAQGYNVTALTEKWKNDPRGGGRGSSKSMLGRAGVLAVNEWAVRITLDAAAETWYEPVPRYVYERPDWVEKNWVKDEERSFDHGIGEFPGQWIRPLPINADDLYPDGACLFEEVIDFEFRINRTISQVGRAFDYAGDPQLARAKGSNGAPGGSSFGQPLAVGGTASDLLELDAGGEAKFVEIKAEGLTSAIDIYVGVMRDLAKAAGAMSRVTPNSKTGAPADLSSVAMKMLNYAQLILSGILRETAAERPGGLLLRLAMRLWKTLDIELPSLQKQVEPNPDARFEWQWPDYYEPHGQEKLFEVQATTAAQQGGLLSQETAVANVGPMFDVTSTDDEIDKIQSDQADALVQDVARETEMGKVRQQFAPDDGGKQQGATPK